MCGKREKEGKTECEKVAMAKIEQGVSESGKSEKSENSANSNPEEEPSSDWKDINISLFLLFVSIFVIIFYILFLCNFYVLSFKFNF